MNADLEEQEDELLALQSIFDPEEFVRNVSKPAGEIRVCAELPTGFTVVLKEDEILRQYELSFLPPLLLNFELPENYPSSAPPSFTLTCSWLTHTQVSALATQLTALYQATGGTVVLFSWVQFLREDVVKFLGINNLLELPSVQHSPQYNSQDTQSAALSKPKNNQHTSNLGPTKDQSHDVSDPLKPDLSAPALEVQHPAVIFADGLNTSTSDWSSQQNLTAHHSKVSQISVHSGPNTVYEKTPSSQNMCRNVSDHSDESAQTSETEQAFRTVKFKDDHHNDLFSAADKSKCEIGFNAGDVSASSPSDPLDQTGQGATSLPVCPREPPQNKDQSSGLTLSQTLLSQILIYDADQKQKVFAKTVFECGVCFMSLLGSECVQLLDCGHIFCQACLAEFCKVQIKEGNVRGVTCPQADCAATPTPAQVGSLVGEELFSRYDRLLLQSTLDCMSDVVYCPRRSCASAVILEKSSTAAVCSVCGFAFCVTCRKTYHGTVACATKKQQRVTEIQEGHTSLPQSYEGVKALMDDYNSGSKERRRLLEKRYGRSVMLFTVEECLSDQWLTSNSKSCPHCFSKIEKNGGCNIMTCSRCRQRFCWACLSTLSSIRPGTHFDKRSCSYCFSYQT